MCSSLLSIVLISPSLLMVPKDSLSLPGPFLRGYVCLSGYSIFHLDTTRMLSEGNIWVHRIRDERRVVKVTRREVSFLQIFLRGQNYGR